MRKENPQFAIRNPRWLSSITPIILILVLAPAIMYPLWSNPVSAGEDDVVFYYPLRKLVGQALAAGQFPVTNPREATSGPLAADPQAALMHPPTWLFAVMDAKLAYAISIFLAFQLAGLGTYFYMRRLGLARPACTFSSIAFMFSGFMVGHRVHLSMIHTAAMLPWGLLCIELLRKNRDVPHFSRPYLASGLMVPAVFLAIAAGSWPTLINVGIIWAAYLALCGRPFVKSAAVIAWSVMVAALIASPQILSTYELMQQVTRQKLGFVIFGENSFFPPAGVLALMPMLMGNRNPNFFEQSWWGPWHQCEMLGYVGLATLVLAGAAIFCMFRPGRLSCGAGVSPAKPHHAENVQAGSPLRKMAARDDRSDDWLKSLVRVWTFLAIGGFIWMLGYYLPTYRLLHMVPVLNVVRCPTRMVLLVDLALACLAGIAIHAAMQGDNPLGQRLLRAIRRGAIIILPMAMLLSLAAVAAIAYYVTMPDFWQFFVGKPADAQAACRLTNPAVYIPLALCAGSALAIWFWSTRPSVRGALLVGVLVIDLFFVARFVDIPPASKIVPDPEVSPAAEWLAKNAPTDRPYRVLGMAQDYFHRPAELLLPKTCQSLGFSCINSYGPFQSPAHAQELGFGITGYNRDWPNLIRRNSQLSRYNVKYLIASQRLLRDVIESVRIASAPVADGPNMLGQKWQLQRAELAQGTLSLGTQFMFWPSKAMQAVAVKPSQVYRISLEARGPDRGAAFTLRAELAGLFDGAGLPYDQTGLAIRGEEIGTAWRSFDYYFQTPPQVANEHWFILQTVSERPIEVRNVSLCESSYPVPQTPSGVLPTGSAVYELKAELPALDGVSEPVAIYENLLAGRMDIDQTLDLKDGTQIKMTQDPPDVGLHSTIQPWRIGGILAGVWGGTYIMLMLWGLAQWRRERSHRPSI